MCDVSAVMSLPDEAVPVAWRRMGSGVVVNGTIDHLWVPGAPGRRTICGARVPSLGECFDFGAGKFSAEQCARCWRDAWWVLNWDWPAEGPFATRAAALARARTATDRQTVWVKDVWPQTYRVDTVGPVNAPWRWVMRRRAVPAELAYMLNAETPWVSARTCA